MDNEITLAAGANEVTIAFTGTIASLTDMARELLGIDAGSSVTVNGIEAGPDTEVQAGDTVEYARDSGAKA